MTGHPSWIGFDLDGTLAVYDDDQDINTIGEPIPKMINRLKRYLSTNQKVKIFTARASRQEQKILVKKWLKKHGLPNLEVTNVKDFRMAKLYDDRAVAVEKNTGKILS